MPGSMRASKRAPRVPSLRLARDSGLGVRDLGFFVVIEGPEGAGKSTLVKWLVARPPAEDQRVVPVREPGGTPLGAAAREMALKTRPHPGVWARMFPVLG